MNAAIIVMTLLGCADGGAACEYIRTADAHFESRAECEAHVKGELLNTGAAGYPSVIAVCEQPKTAASGTQVPAGTGQGEVAEPKVIYSQFDDTARPNPLRWTFDKTRQVFVATGHVIGSVWRGVSGQDKHDDDPIPLGRYVSADM